MRIMRKKNRNYRPKFPSSQDYNFLKTYICVMFFNFKISEEDNKISSGEYGAPPQISNALIALTVLCQINQYLGFISPVKMFIESMRPNSTFISLKLTSFSWHRFETSIQIFNAYRRKGTVKEK